LTAAKTSSLASFEWPQGWEIKGIFFDSLKFHFEWIIK
jgi:hypothetical protein